MYSLRFILDSYFFPSKFIFKFLVIFENLDLCKFDEYVYLLIFNDYLIQAIYY